ncbi:hypothetical protein [Paenibacillus roseipurpureus]|uniref:Uncharacterized protein n=1 Tax=Paenibacillus roseopurpureus TaxID=2918901 RepID=A0AA96LQ68_9BACL|nr:hypothetical protein [Paenibacillus sp. MBLB1832]WNR45119.1 hypothetical protein MJB10_02920 [Paenibacillus sp. MBLB1832]
MLDKLFYHFAEGIVRAGPDWAIIGMFAFICTAGLVVYAALQVWRLLEALLAFIIIGFVTFWPCAMFPSVLEYGYLKFSLITPWYIEHVPSMFRFPTLWLFAIGMPVVCRLVIVLLIDGLRGNPLVTRKRFGSS